MTTPRVLLLTSRADHGGGPAHVLQLARTLRDDATLTVACPREEPYWSRFEETVGADAMVEIGQSPLFARDIFTVARAMRTHEIDIVHSHGKKSGLIGRPAALLARRQAVHTYHGMHTERYGRVQRWVYLTLEWVLSTITAACIAVSSNERDRWANGGCRAGRLHHIANGVAIPPKPRADFADRPFRVAFVGRVTAVKDPDLLASIVQLAHQSPCRDNLRFSVIGDGELLPQLRQNLTDAERDGFITFHGFVDDVPELLDTCQAVLSTSVREGLPLAVLEAFAHGLPVVATDVDGNNELLASSTPELLYATDDPGAAVASLARLLDEQTWRNAHDRVRAAAIADYDEHQMAAATVQLYAEVLGSVSAPASAARRAAA